MIVRAPKTVLVDGRSTPAEAKTLFSSFARPRPAATPIAEATVPMASASTTTEREHLAPGGAERPQQRELTRALRDRDRERVVDRERAHDDGNAAEHEQQDLQELHERLQLVEGEAVVRRRGLNLHRAGQGLESCARTESGPPTRISV